MAPFLLRYRLGVACLKHHGRQPPGGNQRQVIVQEGRDNRVANMIVLAVRIEAGGGAESGI